MTEINEENAVERFEQWLKDCDQANEDRIKNMAEIMQSPIVLMPKGYKVYKKYIKRLKNFGLIVEEKNERCRFAKKN